MRNQFDPNYEQIKANALTVLRTGEISLTKAAKKLCLDRETITAWAKADGLSFVKSDKKEINSNIFNVIDSEGKAYWLGFLYADGYVSDNNHVEVSLKPSDESHVLRLKEFISFKGKIYRDSYRTRLCFKDMQIGEDLKRLGCIPRKSLVLEFPNEKQVPMELVHHFIRGYYDGDGSITDPNKNSMGISIIGTKPFLEQVTICFGVHGICKVKNSKGSQFVFCITMHGKNARKALLKMYKDASVFLVRKKLRYDQHLIRYARRKNYIRKDLL